MENMETLVRNFLSSLNSYKQIEESKPEEWNIYDYYVGKERRENALLKEGGNAHWYGSKIMVALVKSLTNFLLVGWLPSRGYTCFDIEQVDLNELL
jgi:hypothetical protein